MNKKEFPFINGASAEQGMYMVMEGFDVWATDAQWRRMNKRARQHGVSLDVQACTDAEDYTMGDLYGVMWDAFKQRMQAVEAQAQHDVDAFLNDMSIMGMINDGYDDACAPMWGTYCMN